MTLCVWVSLRVCALKGKGLELSTPRTLTRILCDRTSACTDPEVERSKVKVTRLSISRYRREYAGHLVLRK